MWSVSIMYEDYTLQALPSRYYRELLGSAICCFVSNNSFIIENILRNDNSNLYSWHDLIDVSSGRLLRPIKETITVNSNTEIATLFDELLTLRNRIVHSFQITDTDGAQRLATKAKNNEQYILSEDKILEFIKKNEKLSTMLHAFRGW